MALSIQNISKLTTLINSPTEFFQLPVGSTNQRPVYPDFGSIRYNTDSQVVEWYNGFFWYTFDFLYEGNAEFVTPGSYMWSVPDNVRSVSVVCIGGGSGGVGNYGASTTVYSGGGGGLGYKNNIVVVPGQQIQIVVGTGGAGSSGINVYSGAGTDSYFSSPSLVCGNGASSAYAGGTGGINGVPGTGGKYTGDGGAVGETGSIIIYGGTDFRGGSSGGYPGGVGIKGAPYGSPNGNCGGGGGASIYGATVSGGDGESGYLVGDSTTGTYYGGNGGLYGGGAVHGMEETDRGLVETAQVVPLELCGEKEYSQRMM